VSGLICVTGSKGAPGATTLAVALAFTAPAGPGPAVLVDSDPDGGDLAALFGVGADPGLVSLAAACRHRLAADELDRHLQPLGGRIGLLAAPPGAEQVSTALTGLGHSLADALTGSVAVADLGRWRPTTPAVDLVRAATTTVLVVHPSFAGVAHARAALADLSGRCARVVVATRGEHPYGTGEVADALGANAVVAVPTDRSGVSMLTAGTGGRWWRRSALARTAGSLGRALWPTDPAAEPSAEPSTGSTAEPRTGAPA
jgi:hypothetical protein